MSSNEAKTQWYVGAQNDSLYIISGRPPAKGNDDPVHDADRTVIAKVYHDHHAAMLAAAPELFTELEEAAAGMAAILTEYKGVMRPVWIDSIEKDIAKFVALLQRITQSSAVSEQVKV